MAVDSNGRLVEPSHKGMNGHAKPARSTLKPAKSQKSLRLFSVVSRILTWYSIITILFTCPATVDLLTDSSPKICKPYFQLRSVIAPHLQPVYDTYAAPYVDVARPYYSTVDRRLLTPAIALGKKYGAPRLAQAQAFGQDRWEKNVQPQVSKYQAILQEKYDSTIGPHVAKGITAVSPYYDIAQASALQTYHEHILPTYSVVQPYAVRGYGMASNFAVNTAVPYSKWAWATGAIFLDRTVWPRVRILYGENVEPQLVRIGERLGRYRDGKKLKAVVENINSSTSASSDFSTFSSISSSVSSAHHTADPSSTSTGIAAVETPEPIAPAPHSEAEIRAKAQTIVSNDLKTWQEKFTKAADEGSDELEQRITEITDRIIQSQAGRVGNAHVVELEEAVASSLKSLKSCIISIVKDSKDSEASEEALHAAVRKAGVAIKDKAQAVRTWRQNYDAETNSLVSKSAEDTLEILDHIRDLGLQEIGMRWAWTDGITHKDWAKYHQLKPKFDEWRYDVEKVATGHPGLEKARAASEEIESQAMGIAEEAATELARLKETGRWKIAANDSSDDWTTKIMPVAAAVAGKKILEKVNDISEAVAPSAQGTIESVVSAASASIAEGAASASSIAASQVSQVQDAASSVSHSVVGTPQGSVESIVSVVGSSASSLAAEASTSIIGTSQRLAESVVSIASSSASSLAAAASSSIIGTPQGCVESVVSVVSESVSSLAAEASSSVKGTESGTLDQATESAKSLASQASKVASSIDISSMASAMSKSASEASGSASSIASSASSTASKKVWGGAMAQHVEARKIIFEDYVEESDDETFSERLASMASEAGDKYADITRAVSEALLKPTATEEFPMTKLAADKYSSALSAASIALYGTEQRSGESISSVASSRFASAIAAASVVIYGAPAPITDSIASQATGAYNAALSRASENYAHARSLVSAQISGEPKPVHEQMLSSVESAYSMNLAAASSRLQSAMTIASTGIYGTPTPAYQSALQSMSSVAQSKLSEGLSIASAQYADAKKYAAAMTAEAPAKQKLLTQMQDQYYAGIGMAYARYSEFTEAVSSSILPRQTPGYESLYSKASANVIGTTTHKFQAALNTASAHYSSATAGASSQLASLLASISSIGGSQKDVVPTASLAALASSRYSAAVAEASKSYESINSVVAEKLANGASAASSVVIGSETPWTESVASAASDNWEALITKASSQIYGAPTPYFVTRRLLSEAKEYAAQATDAAASQYSAVQSLINDLVVGKEPDFTESVYNRLSSAYYTGAGAAVSSASSYASDAYASASSAVTSVFTPPPTLEAILDSASSQVNAAVEAASVQYYGSSTGYLESAQSSISDAAASAQKAVSEAFYGTPTGTYESATNAAGEAYASATSAAAENYSSAAARVSEVIYGPEKGAVESAQARLGAAVESARAKLAEFVANAGEGASEAVKKASEGVEDFVSSVSSVISSATGGPHDEL